MKKIFIGAIIGGIILLGWQSMSWTLFGIHENSLKYAPSQDTIINFLQNNLREDGQYRIPREVPGSSNDAAENFMKNTEGKPWAMVTYHSNYENNTLTPVFKGLLISIFSVLLVCLVIHKFPKKKFWNIFFTTLSFGIVSFLSVSYNQQNWFQTPWHFLHGELIDSLAGWSLCGIWLGFWNKRN